MNSINFKFSLFYPTIFVAALNPRYPLVKSLGKLRTVVNSSEL